MVVIDMIPLLFKKFSSCAAVHKGRGDTGAKGFGKTWIDSLWQSRWFNLLNCAFDMECRLGWAHILLRIIGLKVLVLWNHKFWNGRLGQILGETDCTQFVLNGPGHQKLCYIGLVSAAMILRYSLYKVLNWNCRNRECSTAKCTHIFY